MKKIKLLFLMVMVASVTSLSSCMFPGPGHYNNGGGHKPHGKSQPHGNNGNNGHNENKGNNGNNGGHIDRH